MCKYCETVVDKRKNENNENKTDAPELMENFPIMDDFTEKEIISDGESPVQYIRRYKKKYLLVTEFADDTGMVITCEISFCPMCGRKLT